MTAPRTLTLARLAVLAAAIAAFGAHLGGDFVWDDKVYLLDNPRLQPGAPLLPAIANPLAGQVFRPLSTATLWLGAQLHGMSMVGFRVAQLALHVAIGLALEAWLRRRGLRPFAALFGAAVFLLHPAATEGVMFANARHDALGTAFALLALLAIDDGRSLRGALLAALATLAAIACKESFVVVAPLLALQVLVLRGGPARAARALVAGVVGGAIVFAIRRALGVSARSALGLDPLALARAYAALIERHLRAFVTWTDAPTVERYVPPSTTRTLLVLALAFAVTLALLAWARRGTSRARVALFGAVIVLFGLAPSIAAIPATGQYGNRYGHFPLVGFAAVLASVGAAIAARPALRFSRARFVAPIAVVTLLAVSTFATSARARTWEMGVKLFGDDVARRPYDSRALYHLGVEVVAFHGCGSALGYFTRAAALEPDWARPFRNLAACELRLRDPVRALAPAAHAVELEPAEAAHRRNLAAALFGVGRREEARAQLAEAERLAPGASANAALRASFDAAPR